MAKEKQEKELETGIEADASVDVAVEQKREKKVSEIKQSFHFRFFPIVIDRFKIAKTFRLF